MYNLVSRTFLVVQVIFGSLLGKQEVFHSGQVEQHVGDIVSHGNASKVIDRLLEEGWITLTDRPDHRPSSMGRPVVYYYRRTQKGHDEYRELARKLRRYGILLYRS